MPLKESVGNMRKRNRSWESSENGKASARRWYKKSPRAMYALYKKSAAKRMLVFDISVEAFSDLITKPCSYCGSFPPSDSNRNGLDRVDNEKGYVDSNLVPCCIKCNQMKGKLSVNDFLDHIRKVVNYASNKK